MEKKFRFGAALFLPFILLAMSAAGCSSSAFRNVSPKKTAAEVEFMPTFAWTAKQPVKDLQFELYHAADFNMQTNQPTGQPIIRITQFGDAQNQSVPLSDLETLKKQFKAEGIFLSQGNDSLNASQDYVWVLRAVGADGKLIVEVYKFHTRKDYYRPD